MTASIARVEHDDEGLRLFWSTDSAVRLSWLWLRDHDPRPESLHPLTRQRLVDTLLLPEAPRPASVVVEDRGAALLLRWADASEVSRYPAEWLAALTPSGTCAEAGARRLDARERWRGDALEAPPLEGLTFDAVMGSDEGVQRWLEAVATRGFGLVEGVPATIEDTHALCRRVGYLRQTIFGGFWDFTSDLTHHDTAYTQDAIPLHTDGTYTLDPPGLQLFHCLKFDGEGGESVLADGLDVAEQLREEDPEAFETLTRVQVPGQYLEEGIHLSAQHSILRLDAEGRVDRITFNNLDRAPFCLPEPEMTQFYRALRAFGARLDQPGQALKFRLAPGIALLFDNWRVLHAREAFTGARRLAGAYFNREDFESRLRTLEGAHPSRSRTSASS